MPKPKQQTYQVDLPPELQKQLEEFRSKLWKIKLTEALLSGLIGWIVTALILFGLDRIWDTPPIVRLILFVLGMSTFAIFAPIWINRWVFKHRREQQLANLISQKYPRLGDRLLGVVELRQQSESQTSLSGDLRNAAMLSVAKEVKGKNLSKALPHSWHVKAALVLASCLTLAITLLISYPEAAKNALARWIMPLSDTPRYTATKLNLSNIPQPYPVPYGEVFSLKVPLEEDSTDPGSAYARLSGQPWIQSQTERRNFQFNFPAQQSRGKIQLKAGDDVESITIVPMLRPALGEITAKVELPSYLQRPDITQKIRSGVLSVLEGSQLRLTGVSTNPLSAATAEITLYTNNNGEPNAPSHNKEALRASTLLVETKGSTLLTEPLSIDNGHIDISLNWIDTYNLEAANPRQLKIETLSDQVPNCYLTGIKSGHTMLAQDFFKLKITAADDFGIRASGLSWQGSFDIPSGEIAAQGEKVFGSGSPQQTEINQEIDFSPISYNISPQTIQLKAWAEDYNPSTERVYSKPITIHVVNEEVHAQIQKRKFDDIINDLEDAFRQEQTLLDETKRLENIEAKDIQKKDPQKRIAEQEAQEQENIERMKKLTERMQELFQETMRNDHIDAITLKKMADSAQAMQQLADKEMPKVAEKLKQSRDQRNAQEKTKQDLNEAAEQQKKNVETMQEIIREANEANKNFEGSTFIARLKRAAVDEKNVANSTIRNINSLIGKDIDQLDPAIERDLISVFRLQERTGSDVRWIQEDLSHYYTRTQKAEHKKLLEAIQSSGIDQGMENLQREISQNHSYLTIDQASRWAKKLEEWSKQLEDDMQASKGGQGSGGQQSKDEQNFEFMLKVMRLIQQEQGIRAQTRALEQLHRDSNSDS